jgi:hypothetical protein
MNPLAAETLDWVAMTAMTAMTDSWSAPDVQLA